MSKAYSEYHREVMAEITAMLEQLRGVLSGSVTGEEFNRQADQHLANMDAAYQQYMQNNQRRDQMQDRDQDEQQTLQLQTQYGVYDDVLLQVTRYQADNSLCIQAYNCIDGPIARLTVCLADSILIPDDDCAFVDTNNCPWAEDFIRQNHLGVDMGLMMPSGYCVYPLYRFDMDQLARYQ